MIKPVFYRLIICSEFGIAIRASSKILPAKALKEALDAVALNWRSAHDIKGNYNRHEINLGET
jgi:hypothetical protein